MMTITCGITTVKKTNISVKDKWIIDGDSDPSEREIWREIELTLESTEGLTVEWLEDLFEFSQMSKDFEDYHKKQEIKRTLRDV